MATPDLPVRDLPLGKSGSGRAPSPELDPFAFCRFLAAFDALHALFCICWCFPIRPAVGPNRPVGNGFPCVW